MEGEKAKRERRKKEATEIAEAMERAWVPRRLSAGRKGQTGRGHNIPIPGAVAHPFCLKPNSADFLYSISVGDDLEARDEWGTWCRGRVVAVRGEGGWVSGKWVQGGLCLLFFLHFRGVLLVTYSSASVRFLEEVTLRPTAGVR